MYFEHTPGLWNDFPELVPGVVVADGLDDRADVSDRARAYHDRARARLEAGNEGEMPEIQAWRRAFSRMGLKPTQYRCASESLLRRFRKDGTLPTIHPLIDLCNAISIAFAVPIAVFDTSEIAGHLAVGYAEGEETYLTFAGETEHPDPGEVVFADADERAHARRWTNRQSRLSAVNDTTGSILIVAEAMHDTAAADVPALVDALVGELDTVWGVRGKSTVLSASGPRYEF